MKRLLITLLLGMAVLCQAAAQNTSLKRHQVRIGWGDMLFETLAFHNRPSRLDGACEDGEITSRVSALTLLYKDGKMDIIGQTHFPREVI